jgi:hypothetical protein
VKAAERTITTNTIIDTPTVAQVRFRLQVDVRVSVKLVEIPTMTSPRRRHDVACYWGFCVNLLTVEVTISTPWSNLFSVAIVLLGVQYWAQRNQRVIEWHHVCFPVEEIVPPVSSSPLVVRIITWTPLLPMSLVKAKFQVLLVWGPHSDVEILQKL